MPPSIPTISRYSVQAFLLVVIVGALGGCAEITIQKPANNSVIALPSKTKVVVTGSALYTGLEVTVDGVDVSGQMASTGSTSDEGDIALAAGPHTVTASANVRCSYCSGGENHSTDTKSFIVSSGPQTCIRVGGPPVITLNSGQIAVGQTPGRQLIGWQLQNGWDAVLIVVEDAPGLLRNQMRVEIDIDPVNGVTDEKQLEA